MNSLEAKLFNVLEPVAEDIGFELVKVTLSGSNRKVLNIAIDKNGEESVNIRDCKNASNNFSAVLDVEDLIEGKYFLEVSSAGIERPLVRIKDYETFSGREVDIKLIKPINDKKKYSGNLHGLDKEKVILKISESEKIEIDFSNIKSAKLIFTDEMFKQSLKKK